MTGRTSKCLGYAPKSTYPYCSTKGEGWLLGQPYAVLCAIDQAVFCQPVNEFLQPREIVSAKSQFDAGSQGREGDALIGRQGAQVIHDAPAKIAVRTGERLRL